MMNLLASVSQWEREIIGERTSDALQHLKAQGKRYCHTVYDNAEVIALMHQLRTDGHSYEAIAQHLNQQGSHGTREPLASHGGLGHCQAHPAEAGEEHCMKLEERLFSPEEVAERLGMSRYTIGEWLDQAAEGRHIGKLLAGEGIRPAGLY